MSKIIIASGPVIVSGNKVLLAQHGADNFWKFAGGRVPDLEAENLIMAAKRRAKEELGVEIRVTNPEPFVMLTQKEEAGETVDVILVHYLADLAPGEKLVPGQGIRAEWLELGNLGKEPLAPNIRPVLEYFGF